jgi:hypothetical protein
MKVEIGGDKLRTLVLPSLPIFPVFYLLLPPLPVLAFVVAVLWHDLLCHAPSSLKSIGVGLSKRKIQILVTGGLRSRRIFRKRRKRCSDEKDPGIYNPLSHFKPCVFFFFLTQDEVPLCSPGWPQTPDPSASASQLLGLQMHATRPHSLCFL